MQQQIKLQCLLLVVDVLFGVCSAVRAATPGWAAALSCELTAGKTSAALACSVVFPKRQTSRVENATQLVASVYATAHQCFQHLDTVFDPDN